MPPSITPRYGFSVPAKRDAKAKLARTSVDGRARYNEAFVDEVSDLLFM